MSSKEGSGGFRKRKHDNFPHNHRREGKNVNSSSPVMVAFKSFQLELDAPHDKYERLVKLSRDLTVESKRTIFLLHRITTITTGLQEYVEVVSFQHFIKTRSLISMEEINKQLIFTTEDSGKENKTPCEVY
uniref:Translin-associated protein X n=1 Tax=Castor canadensis TaxID=51338 RepID=A0A8C0WAI9_CASCN